MSAVETENTASTLQTLTARARNLMRGNSASAIANRGAASVFVIRVLSAGLAYVSQVILARWMGTSDYGVYVYVWTWVLVLASLLDFGMSPSTQKIIPEYRAANDHDGLRGFLFGARWLIFGASAASCLVIAAGIYLLACYLPMSTEIPLYLVCLTMPAFVIANIQDSMARSYDWMWLGLMPTFVIRQALLIALTGAALAIGFKLSAAETMVTSALAVWIAMIGQLVFLNRRLGTVVPPGTRRYESRSWLATSIPLVVTEGTFLLLTYSDILLLHQMRPSHDVGVYYAVVKTLIMVSFIHFAVGASTAHRFSEYHATGDRKRLEAFVSYSIKLTFWPSLVATVFLLVIGKPMLWLFGPDFVEGYGIMFVMAIGLLVRSAVGPVERLLNMLGEQRICAIAYGFAFLINGGLCLLLIPAYGGYGAAAAVSTALVALTVILFGIAKYKLGLHVLPFGRG